MILNILHKLCVGNRMATIRLGNSPNIVPLLTPLDFAGFKGSWLYWEGPNGWNLGANCLNFPFAPKTPHKWHHSDEQNGTQKSICSWKWWECICQSQFQVWSNLPGDAVIFHLKKWSSKSGGSWIHDESKSAIAGSSLKRRCSCCKHEIHIIFKAYGMYSRIHMQMQMLKYPIFLPQNACPWADKHSNSCVCVYMVYAYVYTHI